MLSRIRNFIISPIHFLVLVLAKAAEFALHKQGLILHVSASANTLTNMIPYIFAGLDVVSRERIGFAAAVTRDARTDRVALNQTVNIPVVGVATAAAITPANVSPDTGGTSPGNVTVTISNQYQCPVAWSGDEQMVVSEAGLYDSVQAQRFAQAFRTISNMVESDLAALHIKASRAYGTYNVQPFGTAADLSDMAQMIKIMEDNGAPTSDLQAVLGTSAMANIRGKQSVLFKVNEAGTDQLLRRGIIGDIQGVSLHTSAQVKTAVTVGTNNGAAQTNADGYAVGATTLTLDTAGTGSILDGDIVTLAGDTNKYVVLTGDASVAGGGTIVLAEPGLRQAIPASVTVITTVAATDRNMVFSKSAIVLACRTPYMPKEGDQASDVMDVTDPVSGITFQIALYKQYRQVHAEVGLAWGVKMIAPRHTAILIG